MTRRDDHTGVCLDAGALIAIERGDARIVRLLELAVRHGRTVAVPAGVIAQAWRGGPRQARLAQFLTSPEVHCIDLDEPTARTVGELCAATGGTDVVDGHVALHARRAGLAVVTSDAADIAAFAPGVPIVEV